MKLNNANLVVITESEMLEINGGSMPSWFKKTIWGYVATEVINNWDDIKEGFNQGREAAR